MALHFDDSDALGQLLQQATHDTRRDVWLWLLVDNLERLDEETCNGETMRDAIARGLAARSELIERIPRLSDEALLPEDRLRWITSDKRQLDWLLPRIEFHTGYLPSGLIRLNGRTRILALIDSWNASLDKKAFELETLHDQWLEQLAQDRYLEWFKDRKEGKQRSICAREWLEKNYVNGSPIELFISDYHELVAFFDKADMGPFEKKAIVKDIQRRWNRQRHNERNADKKQINVMLSKKAIQQLDQLVDLHGIKRAQLIEALLRIESEKGEYLSFGERAGNTPSTPEKK